MHILIFSIGVDLEKDLRNKLVGVKFDILEDK